MSEWTELTGILNGSILLLMISGYFMRIINKRFGKLYPILGKILKITKKIHRPLGMLFLIVAPVHGFLALGRITLHTGSLLYLGILLMFFIYILGQAKVLKKWILFHRFCAILVVGLFLLHYFWPWAIL